MAQSDTVEADFDKLVSREKRPRTNRETFAVEVEGYAKRDGNTVGVVGARLDTGEIVKVELEPWTPPEPKPGEPKRGRAAVRPEISNFADPDHKVHVQPGGVIRFDQAHQTPEGTIKAGWAVALKKGPGQEHGVVIQGIVKALKPYENEKNGETTQRVQILKGEEAELVNGRTELRNQLIQALSGDLPGSPIALVRVEGITSDGKSAGRAAIVKSLVEEVDDGEGGKRWQFKSPQDSVDQFLAGEDGKLFSRVSEKFRTEVVPGTILRVGSGTLEGRLKHNRTFDIGFSPKPSAEGEKVYPKFSPGIVSVEFKKGFPFVTEASPLKYRQDLYDLKDVPTRHTNVRAAPDLHDDGEDYEFNGADFMLDAPANNAPPVPRNQGPSQPDNGSGGGGTRPRFRR